MTLTANKLTQLEKLIEKMLDETLTHEEGRVLDRILLDSQDARTYYRRYINIHYGLIARYGKGMRADAPSPATPLQNAESEGSNIEESKDFETPSPLNEVKRRAAQAIPFSTASKVKNEPTKKVEPKVIDELDVLAEAFDSDTGTSTKSHRRLQSSAYIEPHTQDFKQSSGVRWEFVMFAFAVLILSGVIIFIYTNDTQNGQTLPLSDVNASPAVRAADPGKEAISSAPVIKVLKSSGSVQLTRLDQGMQIKGEMPLKTDDLIRTGAESSLMIQIPGTVTELALASHTHIEFKGTDAIKLIRGSVQINDDSLASGSPFKVYTPKAMIEPIGTEFQVQVIGSTTRVDVTKGSVKMIRMEDMKAIVIAEKQYALLQLDTAFEALAIASIDSQKPKPIQIITHPAEIAQNKPKGTKVLGQPDANISDRNYPAVAMKPVPVKILPDQAQLPRQPKNPKPLKPTLSEAQIIEEKTSQPDFKIRLPDTKKTLLWHPFKTIREDQFWDDQSEQPIKLNLRAIDASTFNQDIDHLSLLAQTSLRSTSYTNSITESVKNSQAFSLSIWVNPGEAIAGTARTDKTKPGFIVSIAEDMRNRNFTLSQIGPVYALRFRCSTTNSNGMTDLRDAWLLETADVAKNQWQHLAFTYGADQTLRLFVDGRKAAERKLGGDLNNWAERQQLFIGNEADERKDRGWIGKIADLQIYNRRLSFNEIRSLHAATQPGK